jgi:hypothetical protein
VNIHKKSAATSDRISQRHIKAFKTKQGYNTHKICKLPHLIDPVKRPILHLHWPVDTKSSEKGARKRRLKGGA